MKFTKEAKQENYFLSQPHQPFFTLGVINAIIVVLIFALSYKNIITITTSSLNFHVYTIIYLLFTNIFTGFIFTTYPRFCSVEVIVKSYYEKILYTNLAGSLLYILGAVLSFEVMLLAMIILAISNLLIVFKLREIYTNSKAANKEDPLWILRAFYLGFIGHILMLVSLFLPKILNFSILFSFYMYLIFLTFVVAQKMVPFFSHSMKPKRKNFVIHVSILLFIKTIFSTFNSLEYIKTAEILLDIFIAIFLLREFINWEMYKPNSPAILWVLHLGLFWLPTAFFVDAISLIGETFLDTSFYFLGVHLIAIGFLTTIFIGFATRVTYGHSGQSPQADKFVIGLFWFIQIVVIVRALYSLNVGFGWGLNFLFDISFSTWLLLFILWSGKFLPILVNGAKK